MGCGCGSNKKKYEIFTTDSATGEETVHGTHTVESTARTLAAKYDDPDNGITADVRPVN